jgi:predicted SAM-dependent methyltransferase
MKLHLGCWHRYIPGFIHVDFADFEHIDYKTNIASLPMISDNSVDLIYCSHAFEYFDNEERDEALKEWRRVLKPGGILRLSVPDFSQLIKVYHSVGDINRILGPLFGKMIIDIEEGKKKLFHKVVYDEKLMTDVLLDNQFIDIETWDWRTTEHAAIDDHSQAYFPHMEKTSGIQISLNLQAKKN